MRQPILTNREILTEEFVLVRELRVVLPSESLKCSITMLHVGAHLLITGTAPLPGFLEVVCAGVRYYVLEQALREAGHAYVRVPIRKV